MQKTYKTKPTTKDQLILTSEVTLGKHHFIKVYVTIDTRNNQTIGVQYNLCECHDYYRAYLDDRDITIVDFKEIDTFKTLKNAIKAAKKLNTYKDN